MRTGSRTGGIRPSSPETSAVHDALQTQDDVGPIEAGPDKMLTCAAGVRHSVEALSDAVCLLTVASGA